MNSNGGGAKLFDKRRLRAVFALLAALFAFLLFAAPAWAQGITITKDDEPNPVEVDGLLLYTLTVTNNTTGALRTVVIRDNLPDDVEFLAADVSGGSDAPTATSDCRSEDSNDRVTCFVTLERAGANNNRDTATVQILVEPQETGPIRNFAEVFAANTGTPDNFDFTNPAIDDAEEFTDVVRERNDRRDRDRFRDRFPPGFFDNPNQFVDEDNDNIPDIFDEDIDVSDEDDTDDLEDAENDLNALNDESTDGEGTDGDDFDTDNLDEGDDGVSATADEDGAEASTPGASASAGGDPDEQAPVTDPQGDVVDEVPTSGPLPNTGGVPVAAGTVLALVLFGGGLLAVRLVMIWRERRA